MAQSLSRIWTHLIFSTKHRFPFLSDKTLRTDMHAYLAKVLREQACETLIVNGVQDHIHALFALSRTHSVASVVKEIKRTSSGWAKEISPRLAKFRWQGGTVHSQLASLTWRKLFVISKPRKHITNE